MSEEIIETPAKAEAPKDRKQFLKEEIAKILEEYGGLEGNIPIGQQTNYWAYQNELKGLIRKY